MLRLDMNVIALSDKFGTGATFKGTDKNDAVRGTDGNDNIQSGGGNDRVYSGAGNDYVDAGAGNDYVDAGSGNDVVYAGLGNDTVIGGTGSDKIFGEGGNDWLDGGADNDFIDGGAGNDWMFGGAGVDEMLGGEGADQMWGGSGDDLMWGEGGNDAMRGDDGNDTMDGGAGNDWLWGGAGNDVIAGGAGADWLQGGSGNDLLFGGDGWATDGARNVFEFSFGEGRSLASVAAANGNDILADFQVGKDSVDIRSLVARFYDQQKGFYDFLDTKTPGTFSQGGISITTENVTSYGESSARMTFTAGGSSSSVIFQGVEVGDLGSAALLKPTWKLMFGGDGAETFSPPTQDYLGNAGGGVQMVVYAGGGDDTLNGGSGADRMYGENGNDLLVGNAGSDTLAGGNGDDKVDGGSGGDWIYGGAGTDVLVGGADGDRLWGEGGDDLMYGDAESTASTTGGADAMWGGAGNDSMHGGAGDDALYGEAGADRLFGGTGKDIIDGGSGNDTLEGGTGADTFLFRGNFAVDWVKGQAWLDLGSGGANQGKDVINDFEKGVDKIRLVIAGQPDDKTVFTKSLGNTWLPEVPAQDQALKAGVWAHILTQVDTDGNGMVDSLLVGEATSAAAISSGMVTGDTSWSILVKGVFSNTAASETLLLQDVFEVA
jgi:Ca2+-binding RTX toxin-like protein